MMPLHPPQRPVSETYKEDSDKIILADQLGFSEAWVGQHFTCTTEPIASPLMFMAALTNQTRQIKFGTGVINLPCHSPAVVAAELAQFDHMSNGRLMFGIGPGSLATASMLAQRPKCILSFPTWLNRGSRCSSSHRKCLRSWDLVIGF
jgi:alkanesulfonate monooxygenase SsuD/methylene tetrahydromethanopterin reductase-like flavin-dependent oxidoreductase (luciferase family)